MNYQKHYDELINRGQHRLLEGYTENHHIIPRCMGGGDEKDNLVRLTAEEHYVAHQLLVKIYPKNYKLLSAAILMSSNKHGGRSNNKMYGWLRRKAAKRMSELRKGKTPWNKGKSWSDEMKQKISEANKAHARKNPCSDELRKIRSKNQTGHKYSPEYCRQNSERQRERQRGQPHVSRIVTCPHCKKEGHLSGMIRWHFDKCRIL